MRRCGALVKYGQNLDKLENAPIYAESAEAYLFYFHDWSAVPKCGSNPRNRGALSYTVRCGMEGCSY